MCWNIDGAYQAGAANMAQMFMFLAILFTVMFFATACNSCAHSMFATKYGSDWHKVRPNARACVPTRSCLIACVLCERQFALPRATWTHPPQRALLDVSL